MAHGNKPTHTITIVPAKGSPKDTPWPFVGAGWRTAQGDIFIVIDEEHAEAVKGQRLFVRLKNEHRASNATATATASQSTPA